jgi:class 3 adenylate cyclase
MRGDIEAMVAADVVQLRLLMEELCCDLCRFEHMRAGAAPESVRIDRECHLGSPGAFADIRVQAPGRPPYFVEVKLGYPDEALVRHLARKYAQSPGSAGASRLIVVVDLAGRAQWQRTRAALREAVRPGLELEVWDEGRLLDHIRECFGVRVDGWSIPCLMDVRSAIDRAKGLHAFGDDGGGYEHNPLQSQLLWHFGYWRLRQLREKRGADPRAILPPGEYRNVAVVLADMCSFSSYMRDTRETAIARDCLTAFYSRARYQIINSGGMLYQFAGDEVIGLFGIPETEAATAGAALDTARSLLAIGLSVADQWQRHLDRMQPSAGLHIGIALGDLQIVSLRPFSRTHVGALGDCINLAARLMSRAGAGEILATNGFHRQLGESDRRDFERAEAIELHNVGRIQAWKLAPALQAAT